MKHRPDTITRLEALCQIDPKMLLRANDIADIFGVNKGSVGKWVAKGTLPEPSVFKSNSNFSIGSKSRQVWEVLAVKNALEKSLQEKTCI